MEEGGVAGGGSRLRVGGWGVKLGLGNGGGPVIYAWIWAGPNGPDVGRWGGWLRTCSAQEEVGWLGLPFVIGSLRLLIYILIKNLIIFN